jgi:hypothetical protein|nr:hypothetical protein [Sphingomonas sp. CCH18-H6]
MYFCQHSPLIVAPWLEQRKSANCHGHSTKAPKSTGDDPHGAIQHLVPIAIEKSGDTSNHSCRKLDIFSHDATWQRIAGDRMGQHVLHGVISFRSQPRHCRVKRAAADPYAGLGVKGGHSAIVLDEFLKQSGFIGMLRDHRSKFVKEPLENCYDHRIAVREVPIERSAANTGTLCDLL